MYRENPFLEGDKIICVNDDFPFLQEFGGVDLLPPPFPKKNDILTVDDILGLFVNFKKYDQNHSTNWWLHSHFKHYDGNVEIKENVNSLISIGN